MAGWLISSILRSSDSEPFQIIVAAGPCHKPKNKDGLLKSCKVFLKSIGVCLSLAIIFTVSSTIWDNPLWAITVSIGEPSRGNLINGVKFPSSLHGYKVSDEDRAYTTPEVVGALLDAFEKFEQRYPDSCDIFIGDFSRYGGGRLKGHGSHQNGRDVDIGLFANGNVRLDSFVPMNSKNLDVPKTWHMIQSLIGTQQVQTIYLDKSIQTLIYKYALSEGIDRSFLSEVFRNAGDGVEKECIIQHAPGHLNHMHVRFFAPWSTLAGKIKESDSQKQIMIEAAQLSCLPRRVNYYVKNGENGLNQLAKDFGVRFKDLCKWNGFSGGEIPKPGECVVFYRRGAKPEPVQVAGALPHIEATEASPIVFSPALGRKHAGFPFRGHRAIALVN